MTISDEQFANWLKADAGKPVILAEFDYNYATLGSDGVDVNSATMYLASMPYATSSSDTPASQPYFDCINAVPNFNRLIDDRLLGGVFSLSYGQMEIANGDHRMDFLLGIGTDNRPISFYYGDMSWPRTDFRLMFTAMMQAVHAPSVDKIVIDITDKSTVLNTSVGGDVIGGTGPNADRSKPIVLGKCYQCECLLIDSTDLTYQVTDRGQFDGATVLILENLCDSGLAIGDNASIADTSGGSISINTGTDTITKNAHGFIDEDIVYSSHHLVAGALVAVSPAVPYWIVDKTTNTFSLATTRGGAPIDFTSGTWTGTWTLRRQNWMSNDDGTITISRSPLGVLTADVLQPANTGDSIYGSDIIERCAVDLGGLDETDDFAGPHSTFTVGDEQDFTLGLQIPEARNIGDILTDISGSMRIFYGFRRDGKFTYGRIRPNVLGVDTNFDDAAVVATLDQDSFAAGTLKITHIMPQGYKAYTVIGNRNWNSISSIAGGVTAERIAVITSKGSYYKQTLTYAQPGLDPFSYNKSLTASPEILTLLSTALYSDFKDTEGANWVDATQDTLLPWIEIVECDLYLEQYALELGDIVKFTMPFYNISDKGVAIGDPLDYNYEYDPDDIKNLYFQVLGVNLRLSERRVGITLVHQRDPRDLGGGLVHA